MGGSLRKGVSRASVGADGVPGILSSEDSGIKATRGVRDGIRTRRGGQMFVGI